MSRLDIALAAILSVFAACTRPALDIEFMDCDSVLPGPRCLIDDINGSRRPIRVWAHTNGPGVAISFSTDRGEAVAAREDNRAIYTVTVPLAATVLRVKATSTGTHRPTVVELRLGPSARPDWLKRAIRSRLELNLPGRAAETVRTNLSTQSDPVVIALATSELGHALKEQDRLLEAEALFRKAIVLDRDAGLSYDQARDVFMIVEMLLDHRRSREADQVLDAAHSTLAKLPYGRIWEAYYRASALWQRGELHESLNQLDQGRIWAADWEEAEAVQTFESLHAQVLFDLNDIGESDRLLTQAIEQISNVCKQGILLEVQADLRVRLLESILAESMVEDSNLLDELWRTWEGAAACGSASPNPKERHDARLQCLLHQSMKSLERACSQPQYRAKALLTAGRLAAVMKRYKDVEFVLHQVETLLRPVGGPEHDPYLNLSWTLLRARLALAQGRLEDATQAFAEMNRDAAQASDKTKQKGSEGDDPYQAGVVATVGLAQVLLAQHKYDEGLAKLETAREQLRERSRQIPVHLTSGALMGRFEWVTSLHLERLAANRRYREALDLMRESRVLAVREVAIRSRIDQLSINERQRWSEELNKSSTFIQKLVGMDLSSKTAALPREPAVGEVLFTCHPLSDGWLCLAAHRIGNQTVVEPVRLPTLDPKADRAVLSAALLQPIATLLRNATRLTVLGYGALRQVPMHLLPFENKALPGSPKKTLGEHLDVRYSLDVPGVTQETSADDASCGPALVFAQHAVESALNLPPDSMNSEVMALLKKDGFTPERVGEDDRGGGTGDHGRPVIPYLSNRLPEVGFAHLMSHGVYAPGNSHLLLGSFAKFGIGNVLALERGPRRLALIACDAGNSQSPLGGQELLGLAQAFLLRHTSEVLAVTRAVRADAAHKLMKQVYANWGGCNKSLAGPLQQALLTLLADRTLSPAAREDLEAFRLFVP